MEIKDPKRTCRLGQGSKCCAYLGAGGNGFECLKTDPELFRAISDRIEKGTMNAKGIGAWEECEFK